MVEHNDGLIGNLTSMGDEEIEVPTSEILKNTQLRKHENISGVSEISVISGVHREKIESEVAEEDEWLIGNLIYEEIEVPFSDKIEE